MLVHIHVSTIQIGHTHGQRAREQVHRTIVFYTSLFAQTAKIPWSRVLTIASDFEPTVREKWPAYLSEMEGLAAGAGVTLLDILAINVRTEINFGLFSDGCTSLSWLTPETSFLAQNWDWMDAQKENLICLSIAQQGKPRIKIITEAGLIGKIGLNDAGVGVLLNAIRAKGVDTTRLPCHLALRMVLESYSKDEAVRTLESYGIASSCHMLVADGETGGVALEWSFDDGKQIVKNSKGQVFHSNHYLDPTMKAKDTNWWADSGFRVSRIEELCQEIQTPEMERVSALFKDEKNFPASICRSSKEPQTTTSSTLFNIVMELRSRTAKVTLGRPVAPEEEFEISF